MKKKEFIGGDLEKSFCQYMAKEIEEYEAVRLRLIKEAYEDFEDGEISDIELYTDNLREELKGNINMLLFICENRGVCPDNIEALGLYD